MHPFSIARAFSVLFAPAGAAGDGGAGGSGGSAVLERGAGAGAAGTGAPAAWEPKDDSLIRVDGKDVSWKQYREGYVSRDQHTAWEKNKTAAEQELIKEAQRLERLLTDANRGRGGRTNEPAADPLAEIEAMSVISGADAAKLVRSLQQNGFGPIGQTIQLLQGQNAKLLERLDRMEKGFRPLADERSETQFNGRVTEALGSLGFLADMSKHENHAELSELAEDIYKSHEPGDDLNKEFPAILKRRVDNLRKYFRALDKAEAEERVRNGRKFPLSGGNGTGTGSPDNVTRPLTPREIARRVFASGEART